MNETLPLVDRLRWIIQKASAAEYWYALTDWEEDFLGDMEDRLVRYGDNIVISDRQAEVLERIADKLA